MERTEASVDPQICQLIVPYQSPSHIQLPSFQQSDPAKSLESVYFQAPSLGDSNGQYIHMAIQAPQPWLSCGHPTASSSRFQGHLEDFAIRKAFWNRSTLLAVGSNLQNPHQIFQYIFLRYQRRIKKIAGTPLSQNWFKGKSSARLNPRSSTIC